MNDYIPVYIPTRGRIDRQSTWDALPVSIQRHTKLVCPSEEARAHVANGRHVWVYPHLESIAMKRQFILEHTKSDKIIMLDDDLCFLRRIEQSRWNLRRCTPSDIECLFERVNKMLDVYPQVGLSARRGNNQFFPKQMVRCGRVTNFHAYNVPVIKASGARFHDTEIPVWFTMEDFHMTLLLLEAGYCNAIVVDYAWDQAGSNTKGGCALYRNQETQRRCSELLSRLHPGSVRVVTKATKGGWGGIASSGGKRVDVVINWSKALSNAKRFKVNLFT